jgi:hypothetical protein
MRKDSVAIFGASALITLAIVGGAYYMTVVRPTQQAREATAAIQPRLDPSAVGAPASAQIATPPWTDTPIKCIDPEIGEFWTNAKDCESADLKNRISVAQPTLVPRSEVPSASTMPKTSAAIAKATAPNKPNLRNVARPIPEGLNVSCKFAVGKALEIERDLSAADDPAESIWRENYCKWVNETRANDCPVSGNFFYYGDLCGYGFRAAN